MIEYVCRSRAVRLARESHKLKVMGSNPISATLWVLGTDGSPKSVSLGSIPRHSAKTMLY